jgi:hypothetical protein
MKKLFVLPGYVIGLGALVLITYRTLLAFGTESKAITIYLNRFGEMYLDLVCLVFLWGVCVVGLWSLSSVVHDRKTVGDDGRNESSIGAKLGVSYWVSSDGLDGSSGVVSGVVGESLSKTPLGSSRVDDEAGGSVFSYSVQVVSEVAEE